MGLFKMDLQEFKTEILAIQLSCKVKNHCLVKERDILDRLKSEILLNTNPTDSVCVKSRVYSIMATKFLIQMINKCVFCVHKPPNWSNKGKICSVNG